MGLKQWEKIGRLLLALLASWYLTLLGLVIWQGEKAQPGRGDVIIVLGAKLWNGKPSPILAERLKVAADLYRQGLAGKVIVSGGLDQGQKLTEALAMAQWLREHGVRAEDIITDEVSTSTWENMLNSQRLMQQHGWQRAILVTNNFHLFRAGLTARWLGMTYSLAAAPMPFDWWTVSKYYLREPAALTYYLFFVFGKTI